MTTISFNARGRAPGTFVFENTAGTNISSLTSFNTVYFPVEVDPAVSSIIFPFNTPVSVSSTADFLSLIGNKVPVDKWQNLSYRCVKALFDNAGSGDLRLVRLSAPASLTQLTFDPSASKLGGSADVTSLQAGDVVHLQLSFDGVQLGESDSQGNFLGVPVVIPETYVTGQTETNRNISYAFAEALAQAIEADPEISSAIYVREISVDTSEVAKLIIAPRELNYNLSVVYTSNTFSGGFVLSLNGYGVDNLAVDDNLTFQDYSQALNTAFDGGDLPKGYLICPVAFAKFNQQERVSIGQLMERIAQESDKKWVALVDNGASQIDYIAEYEDIPEHQAATGFLADQEYLVNNNLVTWGSQDLLFNSANYNSQDASLSANTLVTEGSRLALRDNQEYYALNVTLGDDFLSLDKDWELGTGASVSLVELQGSTLPGGLAAQSYFVIASDTISSLANNEIKLASSFSNAINGIPVDITSAGAANPGGNLFLLNSSEPAWAFPQTIGGLTSELIEAREDTQFNSSHLPASLQKQTGTIYFKAVNRVISDTSGPALSSDNGDLLFTVTSHRLEDLEVIYFDTAITTGTGASNIIEANTPYFVRKIDVDTFKISQSTTNFNAQIYVNYQAPDTIADVSFYSELRVSTSEGSFSQVEDIPLIKGRKYEIDATSVDLVKLDETGAASTGGIRIQQYAVAAPAAVGDFSFGFLEDATAATLSQASPIEGSDNFLCVPAGKTDSSTYFFLTLFDGTNYSLTDENIRFSYLEPAAQVPDSLWNFRTVGSFELLDEALRLNNAVIKESGLDNHSKLLNDARRYNTSAGYLAYFAPYVLDDSGVYVPPTPYVVGVALRRYRDEAGFQSPPAGTKYPLKGARGVEIQISTRQQEVSNPAGLNALRKLSGYGDQVFIWGARSRVNTEDPSQRLYQFINTRVIMNVLFGSLQTAFNDVIFSTGESPTVVFNKVRNIANTVMYDFFVNGYLFGNTAEDAYEIVVDERNNSNSSLENGLINVQVFAAPATLNERVEIDLFRVAVGQVSESVAQRGF